MRDKHRKTTGQTNLSKKNLLLQGKQIAIVSSRYCSFHNFVILPTQREYDFTFRVKKYGCNMIKLNNTIKNIINKMTIRIYLFINYYTFKKLHGENSVCC